MGEQQMAIKGLMGGTVGPEPIMYCGFYPRKRRVISFQAKEEHEVISLEKKPHSTESSILIS